MRKKLLLLLSVFLILQGTGCSSLPKKFIRQKPKPAHTPATVYIEKGPYKKKYSNEYYYKVHYTLWKTWYDDLLDNLGGNSKKIRQCTQESLGHLDEMGNYLKPDKKKKLTAVASELKRYLARFENGSVSRSETAGMRSDLERLRRRVANNFPYEKVKADLLPDDVDLGPDTATTGS